MPREESRYQGRGEITTVLKNPTTATVVLEGRGAKVELDLSAADLSSAIEVMARVRSQMEDRVPPTLEPNARVNTVIDASWRFGRTASGNAALTFRHGGFGWLQFVFSDESAARVTEGFQRWETDRRQQDVRS